MVREGEELWPGEEGDEFLDYYSRYRPLANRYSFYKQPKCDAVGSQGADSLPPLHVEKTGENNLNEEISPLLPPPHWDRREIYPNHIIFRTCSALASM
jgi:hypothetical protein